MRVRDNFFVLTALLVSGLLLGACAAAPTPTPTTKPVAKEAATPTKAALAVTPTKAAIRFEGGKFQPLADGFPNKPLVFIINLSVGAGSDVFARAISKAAQPMSPVPIVIENRPDPRQVFASLDDFKSRAAEGCLEGYCLSVGNTGGIGRAYTIDTGGYTLKDINPIILIQASASGIVVPKNAPWKNLKEFVADAKANPGKIRVSTPPKGASTQLIPETLMAMAGINLTIIPHDGAGDALLTLLGGGAEGFASTTDTVAKYVEEGSLRWLAFAQPQRSPVYPNVPTFKEEGWDIQLGSVHGIITAQGVKAERIEWLYQLFLKAADSPSFQEHLKNIAGEAWNLGPADFRKWLDLTGDQYKEALGRLGLLYEQQKKK